jgi:hypothetical protein
VSFFRILSPTPQEGGAERAKKGRTNVWRSLLVKLRPVALVRERCVLIEITATILRSLLELSIPFVILIGIFVIVSIIHRTLPTLNPFLEFG